MRLYDYWRSSAAYRVRLALNFKGLRYEQVPVDLRRNAQRAPEFLKINPQGLVPVLEDEGVVLAEVDFAHLADVRRRLPALRHRHL